MIKEEHNTMHRDMQGQVARDAQTQAMNPAPLKPIALGQAMSQLKQKRHILVTDPLLQLAVQRLMPGEDVPMERHADQQQFLRVESGTLTIQIYAATGKDQYEEREEVVLRGDSLTEPDTVMIPPGTWHRLSNEESGGWGRPVVFYTLYAPPAHTREEQAADDDDERRIRFMKRPADFHTTDVGGDLDALPDELVRDLLVLSYPGREYDWHQFVALAQWRHANHRIRRLIELYIYPSMRKLPGATASLLNDATLRLFPALRRLRVDNNDELSDAGLAQCHQLTKLSLAHCSLSGTHFGALAALTRLVIGEGVWLDEDALYQLPALTNLELLEPVAATNAHVSRLTRLQRLWYEPRVQDWGGLDNGALRHLTSLTSLGLGYHCDAISRLGHLTRLTELTLHCQWNGDSPATLTRLTALDVTGNPQMTNADVAPLTALCTLKLDSLGEVGVGALRLLGNLRELWVAHHCARDLTPLVMNALPRGCVVHSGWTNREWVVGRDEAIGGEDDGEDDY